MTNEVFETGYEDFCVKSVVKKNLKQNSISLCIN